ncbi:MAG TPA: hypothetical protein VIV60_20210, partial [Polyangiaceae bacterium]
MSERSKENANEVRQSLNEPADDEVMRVDCGGLTRAIEMLAGGSLEGEPLLLLMRHELAIVQRRAQLVSQLLQRASVELRQLRESSQREQLQRLDDQRQLQEQNDRFVSSLIQDHEQELQSVRRERDAAIDRVRELSRGMTRVGGGSSGNLPRTSISAAANGLAPPDENAELRTHIDELLFERERSLRLLRQLAEQRDQAETRLQTVLSEVKSAGGGAQLRNDGVAASAASNGVEKVDAALPALANRQAESAHGILATNAGGANSGARSNAALRSSTAAEGLNAAAPNLDGIGKSGYSLNADQL